MILQLNVMTDRWPNSIAYARFELLELEYLSKEEVIERVRAFLEAGCFELAERIADRMASEIPRMRHEESMRRLREEAMEPQTGGNMFPITQKQQIALEIGEAILEAYQKLPDGWALEVSVETLKSGTVIGTSLNHEDVYTGNIEYDRFEPPEVAESIHRLIEIAELGFESCWQK